jgi:hypothetical protein
MSKNGRFQAVRSAGENLQIFFENVFYRVKYRTF